MSVSGIQADLEINLEEFERRLRAPAQALVSISNDGSERRIAPKALDFKGRIRDMTRRTRGFSLQQLIKELKPYIMGCRGYFGFFQTPRVPTNLEAWIRGPVRSPSPPQPGSEPRSTDRRSLGAAMLKQAIDEAEGTAFVDADGSQASELGDSYLPLAAEDAKRHSITWTLKVSGLALTGSALIGAAYWHEEKAPALKAHSIAAAQGSTEAPRETVAALRSAAPPQEIAQTREVKVVQEQPVDPKVHASSDNAPAPAMVPALTAAAQPAAAASRPPVAAGRHADRSGADRLNSARAGPDRRGAAGGRSFRTFVRNSGRHAGRSADRLELRPRQSGPPRRSRRPKLPDLRSPRRSQRRRPPRLRPRRRNHQIPTLCAPLHCGRTERRSQQRRP